MIMLLDPSFNRKDRRYPRPRWLRFLRWVLRLGWLAFLIYPTNALFNILTLIAHFGPNALLDSPKLSQALLLDQLLPLLTHYPAVVIPILGIVVLIIGSGRLAHCDQEHERRVLSEREEHKKHAETLQRAQTVAREEAHATAQTAVEGHLPSLKPVEEVVPEVLGPPFDDALLPVPEHFIGRSSDLNWLLERLRIGGATAITALRGIGGIGKTALAAVAVHQVRQEGHFHDGIVVILCQGLTDATDILRRVLTRFDPQRRQPAVDDFAGLVDVARRLLDGKNALIVLDNIEPELAIEKVVVPLRSAGTTLLLTARQALPHDAVPIEAIHFLGLLSSEEALDLFVQSSRRRDVLDLPSDDRVAAERIIAALDRHTLAVKLAGAYAANTDRDLRALARELEEDPQRAIEIPEGATPRALALVLARSTEKLTPDARQLFVALTAFSTTEFSRRAALALAKGLGLANPGVNVDSLILLALADSSRNADMPEGSDYERLRFHPLLRTFAAVEFALWSEEQRFLAYYAIAVYFSDYANKTPDKALGIDEANIIGALKWAHDHVQNELVSALCLGMRNLWRNRWKSTASLRYFLLGMDAAKVVADTTNRSEDRLRAVDLAITYGQVLTQVGRIDDAESLFKVNLATCRAIGDRSREGRILSSLGLLAWRHKSSEEAEGYFKEALVNARESQKRQAEGIIVSRLGRLARRRGRLQEAEDYFYQALTITREVQDVREQSVVLISLGQVARDHGRLEEAQSYYGKAMNIARELQDQRVEGAALTSSGQIYLLRGEFKQAEVSFEEALILVSKLQDQQGEGIALARLGELARHRGQLDQAQHYYEQSLACHREIQAPRDRAVVLGLLGQLARDRGRLDEAERYYRQSLAIRREVQDRRGECVILAALGQLAQDHEQRDEAEQYYRQGFDILRGQDAINYAAVALAFGTFLIERQNNHDEGCSFLIEAVQLYAKMGLPEEKVAREAAQRLKCEEQSNMPPNTTVEV